MITGLGIPSSSKIRGVFTVPSFLCILKQRKFLVGVLRMTTEKTSHPRQKFLTVSGIIGGGFSKFSGISGRGLLIIKNLVVVILRAPAKTPVFDFTAQ